VNITLRIHRVTRDGEVHIKFSHPLIPPEFEEPADDAASSTSSSRLLLTREELDILEIFEFYFMLNGDEEPPRYRYTVKLKSWTAEGLVLEMHFEEPLLISKGGHHLNYQYDLVLIKVKDPNWFVSEETGQRMTKFAKIMMEHIPAQARDGTSEFQLQFQMAFASYFVQACVYSSLLFILYFKGPITNCWILFFATQYVCYFRFYNNPFPANSEIFLDHFLGMLNFNIINPVVWFYPRPINFLHSDEEYNMALDWSFYVIVASLVPLYFGSLKIAYVFANALKLERGKIARWWATARRLLFFGVFIRFF
jgi:hypothetical protein